MGRILEIDVETSEVEDEVEAITKRIDGDGELMALIAKTLEAAIHRNLAKETGGPEFGTWAPLAQSTLDYRRAHGYGDRPILKNEGHLYKSISSEAGIHTAEAGPESGHTAFYARFHDLGEGQRQRAFVYLLEEDMEGIQDVAGDFYVDGVLNAPVLAA